MAWMEYFDAIHSVIEENQRRVADKFRECEKYVKVVLSKQYPDCEIVWTRHEEDICENRFYVWTGHDHRIYSFNDCGISPIVLLDYPQRPY